MRATTEPECHCFDKVLTELDELAPGAPLLALGQTVFWDEPLKAAAILEMERLGAKRGFVAGVHDTDYFAKFVDKNRGRGIKALPHNDTTTKSLWSAAGEFSALFGSETVVTREKLMAAGGKTGRVEAERPGFLDGVTEAWGWRGVVSLDKEAKITAEKRLGVVFPELYDTFRWAIEESLAHIAGPHHEQSELTAHRLLAKICDEADLTEGGGLADYYRRLLPSMYGAVAGRELEVETTQTTELLRFSPETAGLARFDILRLFLNPGTREVAETVYNDAVRGSEIYTLDRFGAGALPFDLYIPGVGRGTLRLGSRGGLVMADSVVGFSYRRRPETAEELAEVLERKFGPGVVLVGKAVSLVLMLAREFVFVFHEGASGYVWRSAKMARALAAAGYKLGLAPILRIKYEPWDAMDDCCAWLTLPEPLRRPFGTEELSAPSFAVRWREVAAEQKKRLAEMAELKRPVQLVRYLQTTIGGHWSCLAAEYEGMHEEVEKLSQGLAEVKTRKRKVLDQIHALKAKMNRLYHEKGRHWREKIFEKDAGNDAWAERKILEGRIKEIQKTIAAAWEEFRVLDQEQREIVKSETIQRVRERRRDIALEAEIMRLRLIREAVMATEGLEKAGHRPSAWWFPLICPDGTWFRATMKTAEYRLEKLED